MKCSNALFGQSALLRSIIFVLSVFACSSNVSAYEYLEKVESRVYENLLGQNETSFVAKMCVHKIASKSTKAGQAFLNLVGLFSEDTQDEIRHHKHGSAVNTIIKYDPGHGILIVNNNVEYSDLLRVYNIKSTLTVLAENGQFKILHSDIRHALKENSESNQHDYKKVIREWGTGWESAEEALKRVSIKIAKCVITTSKAKLIIPYH